MLTQDGFASFHARLKFFLEKVARGEGPESIVHW